MLEIPVILEELISMSFYGSIITQFEPEGITTLTPTPIT
jgi:hypothetical protein